ncbi:MAG: insulinase family protein, partial [Myxococcota bacterium]
MTLLLAFSCSTKAPDPAAAGGIAVDQALPVDPGVRQGQLDNGLRWFVEVNGEPASRAELRLVVKAGSVLEDDDQLGLAHFVEHMAFNGTENFPANTLIEYLESTGTKFGAHLNAYTSFDRTVYQLRVPTDDAEVFDKGFTVLADWAGGITFADEEIEKERGVVLEEWRRRLGPGQRIGEVTQPLVYGESRYTDRLPIGTEESLTGFAPDAARRFYADWYRPDLMAVIAVGDFDPDAVQKQIEETFGGLANPAEPRPREVDRIASHAETRYAVLDDAELTRTSLQILVHRDLPQATTWGDYRHDMLVGIVNGILGERFADLAREPEAVFIGAGSGQSRFNLHEGADYLGASPREGRVLDTYRLVLTELARLKAHGVRSSELERAKARTLQGYDKLLAEMETTDSRTHARELVRVFAEEESMAGTTAEVEAARAFVPAFTAEEIGAYVASAAFFPTTDRVVIVTQPAKEGLTLPTVDDLKAIEADVAAADVPPLADEADVGPLLTTIPEPGSIVETSTEHLETLGFTVYTLSNGITVWAKPTAFKEDQILFRGFSDGGHSWISDDAYVDAAYAPMLQRLSGLGNHDTSDLQKWKAGRSFGVSLRLGEFEESLAGSSAVDDLESALQQLHALFTAPQLTQKGFDQLLAQQTEVIQNRDKSPRTALNDAYNALVWPDDARRRPWTLERLGELDLGSARLQYEAHFGHATGFTFVFVGNLPPNFEQLAATYLATLPTDDKVQRAWVDRGQRPKKGQLEAIVRKG